MVLRFWCVFGDISWILRPNCLVQLEEGLGKWLLRIAEFYVLCNYAGKAGLGAT